MYPVAYTITNLNSAYGLSARYVLGGVMKEPNRPFANASHALGE